MALNYKKDKKPAYAGSYGFRCSEDHEKKMKETYKEYFDFPDFFRQKTEEAIREAEEKIKSLGLDLTAVASTEEILPKQPLIPRLP